MAPNTSNIILTLTPLLLVLSASAQLPFINYDDNDFEQGIIYEQIEVILVDSDGFNWLGTTTGLYNYDGYGITSYIHNSRDDKSISEDFITALFEDSKGRIWVGTYNNGINAFDKRYQAFEHFYHESTDSSTISSNRIPRERQIIAEDNEGFIWVNTDNALNKIDPISKKVVRHNKDLDGNLIYDKAANVFWIGNKTLKRYDPVTREIDSWEVSNQSPITSIIFGSEDHIWIGTTSGAYIFKISDKAFYSLAEIYESGLTRNYEWANQSITSLYRDMRGNVWMGIGNQIYLVNERTGEFSILEYDQKNEKGLKDEKIRGIYGNGRGTIFISYETPGITKINIDVNRFRRISTISKGSENIGQVIARSIMKDDNGNLWVGTNSNGLTMLPGQSSEEISTFRADPEDPYSLISDYITAIFLDKDERLWVGSFEDGFSYADHIYNADSLTFTGSVIRENFETHEFSEDIVGRIWVCTNNGLYIYDKTREKMVQYGDSPFQEPKVKSLNVQAMIQESPNVFWMATWNSGVARLKINSDSLFTRNNYQDELEIYDILIDEDGNNLDKRLINIHMDRKRNFWLATNNDGLIKMSIEGNEATFEKYDESKGAPSNQVFSIVEDDKGYIWISTNNGIGKLDPASKQFSNFYESDGLLSNSFVWDSYFQSEEGEIFFGGFGGITSFYPDSLLPEESVHQAYLSNIIINHSPVSIGDTVNRHFILDKDIRFMESISLTYNESVISLEFSALNVIDAGEIQFAYQLEGFDEDWIFVRASNRVATYTNIPKGTYYFKVKASKNPGIWGEEYSMLKISVLPPWWRTYWANSIYILFFIGLLYLFQRELVNRAKMKTRLEMEKYRHERDNELNREKFKFFTTLSHELRTPLTLILGPIERMIHEDGINNRAMKNLLIIQKQAQRLQKLTNQLMNFRKYELENLKLKTAEGNIIEFVKEIYVAFRQHAGLKQVNFQLIKPEDDINLYYDRDKLEIVLVNLLSNAFKFTPQHGTVTLEVTKSNVQHANKLIAQKDKPKAFHGEFNEKTVEVLLIKVYDNGIGISPDQLHRVFERYFQASNVENISIGGTGIGLEIAKNYVELHQGRILVESEINKGTTFYVWIPLGKAHLSESDILKDFKPSEHKDHYRPVNPPYLDDATEQSDVDDDLASEIDPELSTLLIVDDNPDIIYFLRETFNKTYNLLTASNGKTGLDKALQYIPDLIISDIMMPEIDGLEFCKKIKTDIRTSHIPVVLLTARTSEVFHSEGLETGADDYINKPFNEKILRLRVNNLIESRKRLRERFSKEANLSPSDISITGPDKEFLEKVIMFIEDHIAESDLKVERLAREIGMSHSVLYKKIIALTGLTIVEFIRTIKLKKASLLLSETNLPINHVSLEVGFTDPKYFSKSFQKYYGVTPSQYKKDNSKIR